MILPPCCIAYTHHNSNLPDFLAGIRGFLHHFYPAYDSPLVQYAQKVSKKSKIQTLQEERVKNIETVASMGGNNGATRNSRGQADDWLTSAASAEPPYR